MDEETYEAIFLFDSDDPEFARGFEAGRIWEKLKTGQRIELAIHATNTEMVMRMCDSLERDISSCATAKILDDDWMILIVEEE